ncbi:MAG: alpha/beta hydrolase [Pseudomonadota bacterium]
MKFPKGYGWKLRLAFRIAIWMRRLGLYPRHDVVATWPAAKRKAIKPASWATYPNPPSMQTCRETISSRGGPLELKWFRTSADQAPSVLFIHGGGWVVGGVDSLDYLCSNLCDQLGVAVIAVDYRLAPDHQFPAGLEDCYDALSWVAARAPGPVTVIGDSAGGNLSAALCLLARDSGGPKIAHQTLIYPGLDMLMESPSLITLADELASRDDLAMVIKLYLGDHDPRDPLASPIHAANLRDLPPAFIVTADCDLLRDDGPRYAEKLRAAGVPVRYENYLDMPHAFLSQPKLCPGAAGALTDIIKEMRPYLQSQAIS